MSIHDAEDVISKISIIYNEPFINFIKTLKTDLDVQILSITDLERAMPFQQQIRDYIVFNQHKIEFNKKHTIHNNDHPNLFAIAICIIIQDLSIYKSFQEILHESHKYRMVFGLHSSSNDDIYGTEYGGQGFKCVCGKSCSPENLFLIKNIDSGLNIFVGCDCAEKTMFIEPDAISCIQKMRNSDPHYKKLMEKTKMQNSQKHVEKMKTAFTKMGESIDSVKQKFTFIGGNNKENRALSELYFAEKYSGARIEDFESEKCEICDQTIKYCCFLAEIMENPDDNDKVLSVCKTCTDILGKMPKNNKGICEDCGEKHRNRSTNLCNICIKKEDCSTCGKYELCDRKGRCEHCQQFNYCKNCDKIKVSTPGWLCNRCFGEKKVRCECGKYFNKSKYYTKCYDCNHS